MCCDDELSDLRAEIEATLTDTAEILARARAPDGQGGFADTWGVIGSTKCRVVPQRGRGEHVEADRVVSKTLWKIEVPVGTDVRPPYRLRVNGATFEVLDTDAGRSDALALTCNCERVI